MAQHDIEVQRPFITNPADTDTAVAAATDTHIASRIRVLGYVALALQTGPVLVLVILCVALSLLTNTFATEANIQNVFIQAAGIGILAIAELIVIVTGGIDLSLAASVGLATVVGYLAYESHLDSGILVLLIIVSVSFAIGWINGLAYVVGKVPHPFIVTLATLSVANGLSLLLSNAEVDTGMPALVVRLGNGFWGPVPMPAVILAVTTALAWWFTRRTQWGRWLYATGGNREAAKRVGIPVGRLLISAYVIAGFCAGLTAVLIAGQTDGASPTLGQDPTLLLNAIAGVFIGGASFFGGRGSIRNALVGAFIIVVIENGLGLLNVSPYAEDLFIGVIILGAVELDVLRANLERRIRTMQTNRVIE
jgi:ribose transport system permease protein